MKHWELTPKQAVTLIRQDGIRVHVQLLFRDTTVAAFTGVPDQGEFWQLHLLDDGRLREMPKRADLVQAALRITFGGTSRHNRMEYGSVRSRELAARRMPRWRIEPAVL
jgi:hypothetical protein